MPGPRLPALARTLVAAAAALALSAAAAAAQVYRVADMNAAQIGALDRARTVVLLPGGVLEEHGPHLPSGTDGYMNAWWTEQLAAAIAARPGWAVLVFPAVPLGANGFNQAAGRYSFPGSYGVAPATLRAVFMDLASELGEQGFRWAFVVHNHGSPLHNEALHQAGDYFRDTYGGRMVHLFGLALPPAAPTAGAPAPAVPPLTPAERQEVGVDVHAGRSETSRMLFVRPDLVGRGFRQLAPIPIPPAAMRGGLAALAGLDALRAPDWPGYVGSPRLATAAFGEAEMRARAARATAAALRILDGLDDRTLPRDSAGVADARAFLNAPAARGVVVRYREVERARGAWLARQATLP
jgi:creatinine amidohydrolase/Fe(II)-dependent formamide hydrolase-like protein